MHVGVHELLYNDLVPLIDRTAASLEYMNQHVDKVCDHTHTHTRTCIHTETQHVDKVCNHAWAYMYTCAHGYIHASSIEGMHVGHHHAPMYTDSKAHVHRSHAAHAQTCLRRVPNAACMNTHMVAGD